MKIYIRDVDDTAQGFPLQKLLREACSVFGVAKESLCEILFAWGYGERIGDIQAGLDRSPTVVISVGELDSLVEGIDEWFLALGVRLPGAGVSLGLHDSSIMFLEGPEDGVKEVARAFDAVSRAES